MTIYVTIGNSDDRLGQADWAAFWRRVDGAIRSGAAEVFGAFLSLPNEPWQSACWAFTIEASGGVEREHRVDLIRQLLVNAASDFEQDSIAWVEGEAEFLPGRAPQPEQPGPGGTCDDCGHYAARHDEGGCHFPRAEDHPDGPCRCAVMDYGGVLWARPHLPAPEGLRHPCGCPAGATAEEHAENHTPDTPGGY